MKNKILLSCLLLFLSINIFAQNFEWAHGFGTWVNDETNAIAHDQDGNFYIVGFYAGGAQFGSYQFESSGSYIIKFSSAGEVLWAKNFDEGQSTSWDVVVDSDNNVIVIGVYYYNIYGDDFFLSGSNGSGSTNGDRTFIVKFTSNGDFVFAKKIEVTNEIGPGSVRALGISTDDNRNIYLVGSCSRSFLINGTVYVAGENNNSFVAKLNSSGNVDWVKVIDNIYINDVVVNENSVFIAGSVQTGSFVDFGGYLYYPELYEKVAYVAKFDLEGNTEWVSGYRGTSEASYFSIVSDDQNNVYALGLDRFNFNNIYVNVISKFHSSGQILYTKKLNQEDYGFFYEYEPTEVTKIGGLCTYENNVYYGAGFKGDFSIESIDYSSIHKNISLIKFNEIGYPQWIKTVNGESDDQLTGITVYHDSLFITGVYSSDELSFDDNTIINNSGNGNADIFITSAKDTTTSVCPSESYSINFDETEFCANDSVQLKILSPYALTINWFRNGVSINDWINDSIYINQAGEYYAIVNQNTSCETFSDTIIVDNTADVSVETNIEVWPLPIFTLGEDTLVCEEILLNLDTLNDIYFLWSTLETEAEITVSTSDIYWLEATNIYGCIYSDTIDITVNPNPVVDLGNDFLITSNETVILDARGTPAYTYLWDNNVTVQLRLINANTMMEGVNTFYVEVTDEYGCSGEDSIDVCVCSSITGIVFFDLNSNGIQDNDEALFPDVSLSINPGDFSSIFSAVNGVTFFVEHGIYSIQYNELPNWELTTGSIGYDVTIDEFNPYDTVFFGLTPIENISATFSVITAPATRCNESIILSTLLKNNGTLLAQNGILWLEVDENIEAVNYIDTPDYVTGGNKFGWNFENIYPGYGLEKKIELFIPGPLNFVIGDSLNFTTYVDYEDIDGNHTSIESTYQSELQCSYDPNDKLVHPSRESAYTLFGESLIYTIRFQNTGNDYAQNVVIKDVLDENIDVSSFRLIGSSHPETLTITLEESEIIFQFYDIFLPDSTLNFEQSQGYVTFLVNSEENLDELTVIANTANIYFDLNPQIITNTTENVMVSTFDVDNDGFNIFEDCDDLNENIYPDAIETPDNGIDEDCSGGDLITSLSEIENSMISIYPNPVFNTIYLGVDVGVSLSLFNSMGKLVVNKNNVSSLDVSDFPAGIYLLKILGIGNDKFVVRRVVIVH